MAEPVPATASEARIEAVTAQAVAAEATAEENIAVVENAAVARAEERIEEVEAAAEDVALAALHTELGRRVSATDEGLTQCRNEVSALGNRLSSMTSQLEALTVQMAEAVTRLPPIVLASSIPPVSEGAEAMPAATVTVVEPNSAEPVAAPVAQPPAKRKIRLI